MDMDKRMTAPPDADNNLAPTPVTSGRVLDGFTGRTDGQLEPQLHSTPSNCTSASASESIIKARAESLCPSIIANVENHKSDCTVENLLRGMLSLCSPEEDEQNLTPDVLDSCLKAVLPICNADAETKEKGLRDYLNEYCQSSFGERQSRKLLISAFNCALQAVREIDVPLRKSTKTEDEKLLFHTNLPSILEHNGHTLFRQPSIVLVTLGTARNAPRENGDSGLETGSRNDSTCSEGDASSWSEYALKTAANSPAACFTWGDSFSAVEVKRIIRKLPLPKEEYALTQVQTIPPLPSIYQIAKTYPECSQSSESVIPSSQSDISCTTSFAQASGSQKRKRGDREESSNLNKKVKAQPGPLEREAIAQSALYAAERMSHACWISHAINLVIIDDVAYVWWYDNEGAIQSYGINFIEDLPYFLVLLLCFDRFTAKDWGIITEFTEREDSHCVLSHPSLDLSRPDSAFTIKIGLTDKIRDHYGVVGRATRMLTATSQSTISSPQGESRNLKDTELVVKISWPEASLIDEAKIIERANEIADKNEHVKGHLPDLIWSRNYAEYSTRSIRTAFGIKSERHRVLRVMLFRRLYPITELTGDRFWKAFWQCFRCHYHLWREGVEHNDISKNNLMYDKANEDRGILNDFDLAHLRGSQRPSGSELTGTKPFMALGLLTRDALKGKITRLYRHDCESFAWVLLWICCRYEDGYLIHEAPLSKFHTVNIEACYGTKVACFHNRLSPTTSYKPYWRAVVDLIFWSIKFDRDILVRQMTEEPPEEEPTIDEVVEIYRNILEECGFKDLSVL